MTLSRRQTLALIGGGMILAAGAGVGWEITRPLPTALAPWGQAGRYDDPRMRALSWAILAPNSHNLQPWKVDISVPEQVVLYPDLTRLFPEGDDAAGLDARPVAICRFSPTTEAPDPLFAHAATRRSNKEPYDMARAVPTDVAQRIASVARHTRVGVTTDAGQVAALRALTLRAMEIEIDTPRTFGESVDLFRIGRREVEANPDGLEFHGPAFEAMRLSGLFTREAARDPASTAFRQGRDATLAPIGTAMAHIWQVTPGNDRATQIETGRDWLRLNLAATAEGVGFHPLSQALQEYPEMAELYRAVHDRLAPEGGTVQMLSRLGYGPATGPTPRWPLDAKLVNA